MLTDLTRIINVVVNSTMVTESPPLVKDEDLRSTFSAVGSSYTLILVSEVGEVEALLPSSNLHVREAIFPILFVVVRIDSN